MTNGEPMELNFSKISLIALVLIGLNACSTGSSGNQPPVPVDPAQRALEASLVPVENTGTGAAIVMDGADENAQIKRIALDSTDKTKVTVDGVIFELSNIQNGWRSNAAKYTDVVAATSIDSKDGVGKDITFYTGTPTLAMPPSGVAIYRGEAALLSDRDDIDDDISKGTSYFSVNFGDKTLTGNLTFSVLTAPINLEATISNNVFNGTATSTDSSISAGKVEGKFYGIAAKELGGMATANDNSWNSTFVAEKQ